jgi:hypothetical protein
MGRPLGANCRLLATNSYSPALGSEYEEAVELSLFPSNEVSYEKNKKRKKNKKQASTGTVRKW